MPRYGQVAYSLGPPLTPKVKWLIVFTSAAFVVTYIPGLFSPSYWGEVLELFGLTAYRVIHEFYLWQLVTYMFLHGGWFHIIFNMYTLWMFGSDLERLWGGKKFVTYYFLTGIGAGIVDVTLNTIFGSLIPTIGCSGAVYGVLLAYGMLFPERIIYLWMMIPVRAKWFAVVMGGIEFVFSFGGPGSGISHFAHLGGMLFGYLYLRGWSLPSGWQSRYQDWRRAQLRRKFEVYMRDQERKDKHGRWVN